MHDVLAHRPLAAWDPRNPLELWPCQARPASRLCDGLLNGGMVLLDNFRKRKLGSQASRRDGSISTLEGVARDGILASGCDASMERCL